jgi:hypothetical protein
VDCGADIDTLDAKTPVAVVVVLVSLNSVTLMSSAICKPLAWNVTFLVAL